ncbi:MAG: hypothetical protein PHY12_10860 [Eubacteriales bacterium]|nr:hypothetical protein [Eubacteriales bacterium]
MTGMALAAGLLMIFSRECMAAAADAAQVFARSVAPALLPMMVLALLPRAPGKNQRREALSLWLFGWLAGSPASARAVSRSAQEGRCAPGQAQALFVLCGVMSPPFFLGTLESWLPGTGMILLAAHWLSALLTGALCLPLTRRLPPCPAAASHDDAPRASLPAALQGAGLSLLSVLGAMMLFAVAFAVLNGAAQRLAPGLLSPAASAALHALLEIGGGAKALTDALGVRGLPLLSALCGFGGFSIWLQNLAVAGQQIRPARLLGWRALHGAMAYGVCRLILLCFPVS